MLETQYGYGPLLIGVKQSTWKSTCVRSGTKSSPRQCIKSFWFFELWIFQTSYNLSIELANWQSSATIPCRASSRTSHTFGGAAGLTCSAQGSSGVAQAQFVTVWVVVWRWLNDSPRFTLRYEQDSEQFKKAQPMQLSQQFSTPEVNFCRSWSNFRDVKEHELLLNRWADESAKFMCSSVYKCLGRSKPSSYCLNMFEISIYRFCTDSTAPIVTIICSTLTLQESNHRKADHGRAGPERCFQVWSKETKQCSNNNFFVSLCITSNFYPSWLLGLRTWWHRLSEQLYDVWKREMFSKMLVETLLVPSCHPETCETLLLCSPQAVLIFPKKYFRVYLDLFRVFLQLPLIINYIQLPFLWSSATSAIILWKLRTSESHLLQ